ncbi:hypothetical protein A6J60_010645 [Psychrobacter sp. FDAARGOS_221]|nr:hypothetical protein A6J60_010645 [Psychrobacter sp. FDAARGOS_221]
MWGFFKFMYPKPPKAFMPKAGDIITPRDCSFCGYPLAEYRGVLESKPDQALQPQQQAQIEQLTAEIEQLQQQIAQSKAALFGTAADTVDATAGTKPAVTTKQVATEQLEPQQMTRKQRKQAKQAYEQQQQQLHDKQQALKQLTTWFFCNYEHQASFHTEQTGQS